MSIGMASFGSRVSLECLEIYPRSAHGRCFGVNLGSFLGSNDGAALVLAALLAHAVGKLLLATVRAVGDAHGRQEVVAAAFCGALFGVPALWIRHGKPSSNLASQLNAARPKSDETQSFQTFIASS
jgi:hypothetical protein